MPLVSRAARHLIALRRVRSVLEAHVVANDRILEQKISDAGPFNQRIDPHILTVARKELVASGEVVQLVGKVPWFHRADADLLEVAARFAELSAIYHRTTAGGFSKRLGQTLEIAIFRALQQQTDFEFFGAYPDLGSHDDSTMYKKTEPPSSMSGRDISPKNIDFLIHAPEAGWAGIEVKNIRPWMYPSHEEIRETLWKCCTLNVVPVLIARRIHFSTFSVLNPCGVIMHQTFNQLYPSSDAALAEQAKQKDLLGYHDVRTGNEPDARLLKFTGQHLIQLLPEARRRFDRFHDLLLGYSTEELSYESFAARVKRRTRGEPEEVEPEASDEEAYSEDPPDEWEP